MPINTDRYPPNWKEIAERIKKRDNYQCQHCQRSPPEVTLTTAHLDHDETNWEVQDDRLATLCAACHLNYDRHDNMKRRHYGQDYRQTWDAQCPELPLNQIKDESDQIN